MKKNISICWFRQDLRVNDNLALLAAAKSDFVLPIYILDNKNSGKYKFGEASNFWLHYSLKSLNKTLDQKLSIYQGNPLDIIKNIIKNFNIDSVYWNRCYEKWQIDRDIKIKKYLINNNIKVETFNGTLLWEPWTIKKSDGTPYKVFTPFYRKGCLQADSPRKPILNNIKKIEYIFDNKNSKKIEDLNLLPNITWHKKILKYWQIGEKGALKVFSDFIENKINNYKDGRDIPSLESVSRLSPYLRFGEISVNQIWYGIKQVGDNINIDHFCSELGWREFSYSQLFYNPELAIKNLQKKFDNFPWKNSKKLLIAWQQGLTGIPMVDAGMRELWETGYMHNRVRMIVGSFLVKNLRLHWHHGERWFWDTLVDADLANNSASWQWVAGCGADAAPYFRIFNPVTQGQKFDSKGLYIRKYVPEIKNLPDKYICNPWEAPNNILEKSGVKLGEDYPFPIVDLKKSRQEALDAFKSISLN